MCVLMFNEMSIHKHVKWEGYKVCAYVNICTETDDDSMQIVKLQTVKAIGFYTT